MTPLYYPKAVSVYQFFLNNTGFFTEQLQQSHPLFLYWAAVLIFSMVSRCFAIGVFLLIEVQAEGEADARKSGVAVEAWVACLGEGVDETHFTTLLVLKGVAGSPEQGGRIFTDTFDENLHDIFILPSDAF